MRTQVIGALVALGLSAVIPSAVKADRVHEDRRDDRREIRHDDRHDDHFARERGREHFIPIVVPDFCVPVSAAQLPGCVIDAAVRETGGCVIVSANYERQAGAVFYDVRVGRAHLPQEILRIGVDGCLIR